MIILHRAVPGLHTLRFVLYALNTAMFRTLESRSDVTNSRQRLQDVRGEFVRLAHLLYVMQNLWLA